MLVLSATYRTHFSHALVSPDRFNSLMLRTIGFLRKLAPISPTCAADCGILEKFYSVLFPGHSEAPQTYHNEGVEPMSATNSFSGPST